MSAKHEPGYSGDGRASEAAPRVASDAAPSPESTDHQVPDAAATPEAMREPPVEEAADHEAQLEHDLEELSAKAEKADEYLELAQRTKADFENYRRRASREAASAQERGVIKLARELLPAVDNLERALAAAESVAQAEGGEDGGGAANVASGIKLVYADVMAALARAGIKAFSPEGEQFDPQLHEAVAQQPFEGAQPGTVMEVFQRGYAHGDQVIRPARVLVAG